MKLSVGVKYEAGGDGLKAWGALPLSPSPHRARGAQQPGASAPLLPRRGPSSTVGAAKKYIYGATAMFRVSQGTQEKIPDFKAFLILDGQEGIECV